MSTDDEAVKLFAGSVSSLRDGEMSEGTKGSQLLCERCICLQWSCTLHIYIYI
jgi:hypothetical protein